MTAHKNLIRVLAGLSCVLAMLGLRCVPPEPPDDCESDAGTCDAGTAPDAGPGDDDAGGGMCSGKPGAPGMTSRSVVNGLLTRTFLVHIPEHLDPTAPVPVVFVHHGFTMSGLMMSELTSFVEVADREGFIVVFPDGAGFAPWNVGTGICGAGAAVGGVEDDFAFVDKMLDDIEGDHCIDRDAVFTTGFSMGGYFTNHIGCQEGDKLRAIAPHSGGTYPGSCPGAPIPVMIVHGTIDWLIVPQCGIEARDHWVARNGCSAEFDTVQVAGGHCEWHRDCPSEGQVVLCLFDGMNHGWAGADPAGPHGYAAGGTQFENGAELIWDFFEQQL